MNKLTIEQQVKVKFSGGRRSKTLNIISTRFRRLGSGLLGVFFAKSTKQNVLEYELSVQIQLNKVCTSKNKN